MVLDLKVPRGSSFADLLPVLPVFLTYVLSFIYTAIYWNNHHHMFLAVKEVNGAVLWANSHLLFWLSIVPFTTAWASESHFAPIPTALYGIVLFLAAIAFTILQRTMVVLQGPTSILARALGADFKGKISPVLYFIGVVFAVTHFPAVAAAFYVGVAIIWLVPDRRIEHAVTRKRSEGRNYEAPPESDDDEDDEDDETETPVRGTRVTTTEKRDIKETNL